ncbi:hydroxysqualene dehydroxylase HpnE [Thalassoglobus sp.]|uniref:hydroxysqualene dehydroxylase HpnE n=1 Tax=Thalassoglobus sp. TaxID=2795869 RepID=UPI003AA86333
MTTVSSGNRRVAIIGGGIAGIAAASALAKYDFRVSLYEARSQFGGRAGSYHDQSSGEEIDNCQHVNMACCTNLKKLSSDLGFQDCFETQKQLHFVAPDGAITSFNESWLPAPLHLTLSFLRLPYLSFREKRLFGLAVKALARTPVQNLRGRHFADWLREHKQTDALIKRVWEVVLVSALSESLERIDAAYAQKVFIDGFLANREGWRVEIPTESLDDLYSKRAAQALQRAGVQIHQEHRLRELRCEENSVRSAYFANEQTAVADEYILAVPHHQVPKLLPAEFHEHATLQAIQKIETAPITSVHLWLDRKITHLPHAVLVDRLSQWMFARRADPQEIKDGIFRYQVVMSASRSLSGLSQDEVVERVFNELKEIWSDAADAKVVHSRVITEKRAVFSVTPGIDELRPQQQSFIPNLQFAGDWTQTDWPATMEGAARSGYLAAENILRKHGIQDSVLEAGLPKAILSRWLFGLKTAPD